MAKRKEELMKIVTTRLNDTYSDGRPYSRDMVTKTVETFLNVVAEQVKSDGEVSLSRFGIFKTAIKPATTITTTFGGDEEKTYEVPEKTQCKFKPYSALKEFMNDKNEYYFNVTR